MAILLAVVVGNSSCAQVKQVYILTGQSNSLGTTNLEGATQAEWGPGDDAADANTEFFWSNVSPSNSVYPPNVIGDSSGAFTTLQIQQGESPSPAFWGPEFGFARRMSGANQDDIVVIKASRGGGGNSLWDQGVFDQNANSGHMWGHLRDQVDIALAALDSQSVSFEIRGLMYLQGESNNTGEAQAADTRLEALVSNLTTHIESTYPGTTADLHTVVGEIAASNSNANRQTTTTLQQNLGDNDPNFTFVATADLPLKSDNIHFGRDAKLAIGERIADAYISLLQQPNGVSGDVNQDGVLLGDGTGDPDADDVAAFLQGWRSNTAGMTNLEKTLQGDLNLDGITNLGDAFVLHNAYQQQGQGFPFQLLSSTDVPEPPTVAVAAVMFVASVVRCRVF